MSARGGKPKLFPWASVGNCEDTLQIGQRHVEIDNQGEFPLRHMEHNEECSSREFLNIAKQTPKKYKAIEEDNEVELDQAWGDVSGATLNPKMVRRAREEDIEYVRTMNLYEKVPPSECFEKIGGPSISVRWIDISKGDEENPNYRPPIGGT